MTGLECTLEQLGELNILMQEIVLRTIKWYSRLPKHLK